MSTLAVSHDELEAMFLSRSRQPTPDPSQPRSHPSDDSEGQALESHEVIELQTFSERKAWIEEKIKFLEKLPPIEVFVGLDALRNSAEEVPGLPTREQLQQWVDEHDFIEKETEVFDKGELKKLRQITKAATQRNLSPEDTDLIELTLTTIYALDKLLHLLRDRSENLDLLGIRLDWEEHRTASWVERGRILGDLESFLATRARWSPSVYEITPQDSPVLSRRASVTSLSTQDSYSLSNPAFARSARFKLAEQLSRDAAQFGARVANLSHGRVATAGRMLDKLIDHSRRPVPDVLLDEQDRLEERGINQMENVGKFVLSLVMQWRKADDTYVETLKDQDAAKDLEEEIATARLSHPTFRQSSQFSARVDTLLKRLSVRVNPTSKVSGFPRPEHPLFPKQAGENESLANFLSAEITTATELVQKVEAAAKEYRDNWEAVRRTEIVVTGANELSETLTSIVERLSQGVPTEAEEGSPPDLSTSDCLQPNRHSLFLALLPSIQAEAARAVEKAIEITEQSQLAFYALDSDSVDPIFTSNASDSIRRLIALKDQCQNHLNTANQQVTRLREARQIWTAMDTNLKELQCLRDDIVHLMERDSWKQAAIGHGAPPTPETPTVELTPITPAPEPTNLDAELQSIDSRLAETVDAPLRALTPTLDPNALQECLTTKASSVRAYHEGLLRMNRMLKTIQTQSSVMAGVRDEYNTILIRIEDAKAHLSALTDNVLGYDDSISDLPLSQASAKSELEDIHLEAATFIDSLSSRVPFLSALGAVSPAPGRTTFRRPSQSSVETEVEDPLANLPLDPGKLDAAVREDSNTFVMRLRGSLETVGKATRQLEVAQLGKFVDGKVESASKAVAEIEDRLSEHADLMKTLPIPDPGSQGDGLVQQINSILAKVEELSETRGHISRCFSPIRDLLRKMDTSSHDFEPAVRQSLFTSRLRITENVEGRFKAWFQGLNILKDTLSAKIVEELERLEKERRGTEERARDEKEKEVKEEQQRREREEEDRAREEKRRREEEERAERARLEEARRRDEEAQAERARLEKEAIQEEDRQRAEEKARLEAERARETRDLLTQNEVDKARLLQERKDIEAKLRQAEALLQEERRLQAERERLAAARTLLEKSQIQEEATQRLLAEQKTRDELLKADADRLQAAEGETKRLQRELEFIKAEHKRTLSEREVLARQQRESQHRKKPSVIEDVFSIGGPSDLRASATDEERQYQALIFDLRKRLRSLSINELARPSKGKKSSPSALPTADQVTTLRRKFSAIIKQTAELPESIPNLGIDADLRSLRMELESSEQLMDDIENLLRLSELVSKCDTALSDLLEHIDSYPAPPLIVSDLYTIDETSSPPEQLVGRVAFTRGAIDEMQVTFNRVCNDARARSERTRIVQTWLELEEMANDRLGGRKSRPGSVSSVHSGRLSSASMASSMASYRGPGMMAKKRTSYSNLSVSVNIKDGKLAPPGPAHPSSRRVVSTGPGEKKEHRRSSSRQSISTSRSVSGPGPTISAAVGTTPRPFNASIMGSTFASRQRTGSVSSLSGTPTSGRTGTGTPVQRARAQGQAQPGRHRSPSVTDTPIRQSFGASAPPRTKTTSGSTWSRAPRNSLSSIVPTRTLTPQKPKGVPAGAPRKKYVADPKNKLDVAVGEVINQLSVGINVEGVAETWRDQSGKYWIGNQDPKLCFCRILRSQTVMVRVGGGWQELSKFIKDHFAESFRLLPESSPPEKLQEEKWISSVTLLMEKPELTTPASPPRLPKTPEPQIGFVPSFAIVTPSGHSPRSILSSPGSNKGSSGSPLTPMQFMRRADADPTLLRPGTPSKTPTGPRQRTQAVAPSALGSVWRP